MTLTGLDKNKILGNLASFSAYTIFGINIVTCKDLSSSHLISPLALFCLRAIGAGLLFWILSFFCPKEKVALKDYPKIFAASFVGFFLVQFSFLSAIPDVTPMTCSIISALTPIYTMFIAAWTIKEPITWKKAGGVFLSFCGIVFLIINSNTGGGGAQSTNLKGVLLMITNGSEFRYLSRTIQTVDFQVLCSYLHEVDFPLRVYHARAFLRKRTRDFRLRTAFRYHNH